MKTPTVLSILYLDPCKYGSMEEYTAFLSRALREHGWRSVLVFSRLPPDDVAPHLADSGATIEVFRSTSPFRLHADLMRILWKYRAEVVHFHFFNHFSLLPIMAWIAGARRVFFTDHVRQPQPIPWSTRFKCRWFDRIVLRLLDTRVMAVSQHIQRTLVDCYQMSEKRVQVLYNGINLTRFTSIDGNQAAQLRAELRVPPGGSLVVCVAALRPEKGVLYFLRAAQLILAAKPSTVLVVVGDGPQAEELREEARRLGIDGGVRFTGLRSDVARFLAAADVVAVPSVWQDPAPLVVVEGMALSRPVVATRVGGIPELLAEGETGLLVEASEPEQLAQALLQLLDSPQRAQAMGRAGRTRVEQRFAIERWIQDTLRHYGIS
jgi:glycosyltransferase involved in cell wall biosynthesis